MKEQLKDDLDTLAALGYVTSLLLGGLACMALLLTA